MPFAEESKKRRCVHVDAGLGYLFISKYNHPIIFYTTKYVWWIFLRMQCYYKHFFPHYIFSFKTLNISTTHWFLMSSGNRHLVWHFRENCRSPALLDVAHSFGELMVLKALQYGLHSRLWGGEAGHNHGCHLGGVRSSVGQVFVLQIAGYGRLSHLQAGLQIGELSRHVQKLRSGRETDGSWALTLFDVILKIHFKSQRKKKKLCVLCVGCAHSV